VRLTLPGTALETTHLELGCAELFRLPSSDQRRRALDRAFEAGIRHFDVAPMYGLGAPEHMRSAGSWVATTSAPMSRTPGPRAGSSLGDGADGERR